jgi:endosialidase-like protein
MRVQEIPTLLRMTLGRLQQGEARMRAMTFVLLLFHVVPAAQAQVDAEARGDGSRALGNISTAIGSQVTACKGNSTAFGLKTMAESDNSFIVGRFNVIAGNEGSCGTIRIDGDEPLFVVGNGTGPGGPTSEQRKNALTVLKEGRVIIGTLRSTSTSLPNRATLNVLGNADISQTLNSQALNARSAHVAENLELASFASGDAYVTVRIAGGNRFRSGIKLRVFNDTLGFNIENDERGASNGLNFLRFTPGAQGASAFFIDKQNGNIGMGGQTQPRHPIEHRNGARLTVGGVWTNASSITFKENIRDLSAEAAVATLEALQPVRYVFKADPKEEHLGFIAEDVPDLVATSDRKALSPMDIVAILTKVVQQQQGKIAELEARLNASQ